MHLEADITLTNKAAYDYGFGGGEDKDKENKEKKPNCLLQYTWLLHLRIEYPLHILHIMSNLNGGRKY